MSIEEVEEKYNFAQLMIMTRLQKHRHKDDKTERSGRNVLNKGKTAAEKNRNAMRYL